MRGARPWRRSSRARSRSLAGNRNLLGARVALASPLSSTRPFPAGSPNRRAAPLPAGAMVPMQFVGLARDIRRRVDRDALAWGDRADKLLEPFKTEGKATRVALVRA